MADTFKEYFHELSETSLKENFVTVYEVRPQRSAQERARASFTDLDGTRAL